MSNPTNLPKQSMQLASLLLLLSGEGADAFNGLCEPNRQGILWLASDLADEISAAINGPEASHE